MTHKFLSLLADDHNFPCLSLYLFTSLITSAYAPRQILLFGNAEHSDEQNSVCAGELQEEALQAQAGL